MRTATALVLLGALLASANAQATCGPYSCYLSNGCKGQPTPTDIVFAIDTSGSMVNAINGVVQGVQSFVTAAVKQPNQWYINANFALVEFSTPATDPTLYVDMTANANAFLSQVNLLTPQSLQGWRETGLETMRCISQACVVDNMDISYRTGAKRILLFFTDEDSDPANHLQNSFEQTTDYNKWCAPYSITGNPLPPGDWYYQPAYIPMSVWTSQWQAEITYTANVLIKQDWSVYILNNNIDNTYMTCLNFLQYGNPNLAAQNPDYSGWNPTKTLANLCASYSCNSVQGLMLAAGKIAKTFFVYNAAQTTFVTNFLTSVASDATTCSTCQYYPCSNGACQAPINICDCAGQVIPGAPTNLNNPTHVTDKNGACCLASQIDCAGVCNGGAFYSNLCGVCVPAGTSTTAAPSGCIQDCTSTYYLSAAPTGAKYLPLPALSSPAGYMIATGNSDLITAGAANGWTAADAQNHYQTYGRFEGRYYCTFDSAYYASANGITCSGTACETSFFTNLKTAAAGTLKYQCVAGSLNKLPPHTTDNCNQCISNPSSPPPCVAGCSPAGCGTGHNLSACTTAYYGQSATPLQLDSCGVCNGGNQEVDDCGVCFGGNAEKDPCGNCPGSPGFVLGLDKCNNYLCNTTRKTCDVMCNGVSSTQTPPPMGLDHCGNCVALANGVYTDSSTCALQCDGTYYDPNGPSPQPTHMWTDLCAKCVAYQTSPNCAPDCAGRWGGTATYDACGQCVGGNSTVTTACLVDCNGTHYVQGTPSPNVPNGCGTCVPRAQIYGQIIICGSCVANNSATISAQYDNCHNCLNAPGYNSTLCAEDCSGVWYNTTDALPTSHAQIDFCGNCITPANHSLYNWNMDNCGVCWPGGKSNPHWNQNLTVDPRNNVSCGCNANFYFCATLNTSICYGDCPPLCPAPNTLDRCLRCSTSPFFNKYDACGQCCNSNTTCAAGAVNMDLCGTCYGPITTPQILAQQPCGVCPAGTKNAVPYTIDCAGVCNGTHVYDCSHRCGINGSDTFCTMCDSAGKCQQICGNGIREGTEQCDDGASNGKDGICTKDCTLVPQSDTAAIVGGVVGGVAGLALLAAVLAFLIYYARANGLMGFGNKKVDMGSANTNPLFKQQTTIATNPLYQNV